MKILVVARNPSLRTMILRTIERQGLSATLITCDQAEEARALTHRHQPDWFVIDLEVEGGTGLEVATRIRAEEPDARILFLTDYDDADYLAAMRAGGGDEYLLKENVHRLPTLIREADSETVPVADLQE